jgi:hypothetical protein
MGWSPPIYTLISLGHSACKSRVLDSLEFTTGKTVARLTYVFKFIENV